MSPYLCPHGFKQHTKLKINNRSPCSKGPRAGAEGWLVPDLWLLIQFALDTSTPCQVLLYFSDKSQGKAKNKLNGYQKPLS